MDSFTSMPREMHALMASYAGNDSAGDFLRDLAGDMYVYDTIREEDRVVTRRNGLIHSTGDQPAVIWADGDQYWYRDGVQHRDNDQPAVIEADGARCWYRNDEPHRDNDQPAVIEADGTQEWYRNGVRHRDNDQPAVIEADGTREWYRNGELHRDNDQPAVIEADGTQEWYRNGVRHRDGDQPAVIWADGTQEWYRDDKRHRDGDQPAIIKADGTREWYRDGVLHRDNDRPAIIYADCTRDWFCNGERSIIRYPFEKKISEDLIEDYYKYASYHHLDVTDEGKNYINLINTCNVHHQNTLLETWPYLYECPCSCSDGSTDEELERYRNGSLESRPYVDDDDTNFFRFGYGRCSQGCKVDFYFEEEDLPPGFIYCNYPIGCVDTV